MDVADYAIYKNITKFTYVEADDIEAEKGYLEEICVSWINILKQMNFMILKRSIFIKIVKDYQIPQGSSISAVYANVYMIDFDKRINDFITSQKGIYRRYCDDIIVVIPLTRNEINCGKK